MCPSALHGGACKALTWPLGLAKSSATACQLTGCFHAGQERFAARPDEARVAELQGLRDYLVQVPA